METKNQVLSVADFKNLSTEYLRFPTAPSRRGREPLLTLSIRLSNEVIEKTISECYEESGLAGEDLTHYVVQRLVKEQGGWYVFIDDERAIHQVTDRQGVFAVAKTYPESLRVVDIACEGLPIRHVYFDYWLGTRSYEATLDAAKNISKCPYLAPNFTYSVHSADSAAQEKIAAYLGKDKYAKF